MKPEDDILDQAHKHKIQKLHKEVGELLDKEGYQLSAFLHITNNGIVAVPVIIPKKLSTNKKK